MAPAWADFFIYCGAGRAACQTSAVRVRLRAQDMAKYAVLGGCGTNDIGAGQMRAKLFQPRALSLKILTLFVPVRWGS